MEIIMINKVELNINEHLLDESDGPGSQSIDVNLYVQGMGATPAEKAAIREIMNAAKLYIDNELKKLK
jgi:hypothetical protein